MREVVIVSAARTPIGSFGGSLKDIPAVRLGSIAVKEALRRGGVEPGLIDEVVFGNVLQAGLGQNVARQVAMEAEIPKEVPAITVIRSAVPGFERSASPHRSSKPEMRIVCLQAERRA
jgi:acetyl-CoA C-acetyltransferase